MRGVRSLAERVTETSARLDKCAGKSHASIARGHGFESNSTFPCSVRVELNFELIGP
jgi:hypothetical protein